MAIAGVQRIAKSGVSAASVTIGAGDGWATPTAGNYLVVTANSDATVNTPTGFTLQPSVVDGNGAYIFVKVAAGTESSITVSPTSAANTSITACEYSGTTAAPFDTSNTSTITNSGGNTTTSVTVTTAADGELVIALAAIHLGSGSGGGAPTGPSWTNGAVNQLTTGTGGTTATDTYTFYAELTTTAAGSYSTACSWTGNAGDRQELVIAIKAVTSGAVASPRAVQGPGRLSPTGRLTPWFGTGSGVSAVAVGVTEAGAGSDAATVSAAVPVTDTGSAADALTVASATALPDAGAGSDAVAVAATLPLTEAGSAADAIAAGVPITVTEAGAAADTVATSSATPLAETGSAADALAVSVSLTVTDTAAGADALGVLAALALAEAASALDASGVTAAVPTPDAGSAADALAVQQTGGPVSITLAEAGAARDRIHVLCARPGTGPTGRPNTGTTTRPNSGTTYYQ